MRELWFFLCLFKPYKYGLSAGVLFALLTAFSSIALLMLSGWFITASALAGLTVMDVNAVMFNFMLPAAQIRALAITRTVGRYAERLVTHDVTFRSLAGIRSWFFQQVIPLAPGRLSTLRSSDLLSRMTADIDALDALYLRLLLPAVVAGVGGVAVIIFLAQYSPLISFTTACLLLLAAIGVPWIFNRLGSVGAEQSLVLATSFRIRQIDLLQGFADIVSNQAAERFSDVLHRCSDLMLNTQRCNNRLTALSAALSLLLAQISLLTALSVATLLLRDGVLSGAEMALVVFGVLAVFELVTPLPPAIQMLAKTQKAARRLLQVTEMMPTIQEPLVALTIPLRYDLQLDKVSFRYTEQQDWVLKALSLTIPHGAKVAIVGASGSGKTTLLQLLLRYYDPVEGRVLLAGEDIRQFNSDDYLSCFGVLSQRSQLFAASIKENILLAKPNATASELAAAIHAAGLSAFIQDLPEGLQTWVGENGLNVSGGEARRIALARLYLKNAPVLILDEPTEGLDSDTEHDVLKALLRFAEDKTVIMVTHRQAGLPLVDVVYELQQGILIAKAL
ncbi:MAG: thiol reductant ABC exporter subunit CydC [Methylococcales bacterium]|nr:thiol reductant ABC exporter subunit CydC [Methylococcales bacterium]